jgi:hypothetical protein
MKTQKTISRILSTAAVAALSMSSLFAQTNLGADCGCPNVASRGTAIKLSTLGSAITDTAYVFLSNGDPDTQIGVGHSTLMTSYILNGNLTLTCDKNWEIDSKIYVPDGKTITIMPGTVIKGDASPDPNVATALIIERGGKIIADGTPTCQIVFTATNDKLDGKYPITRVGDWGGLVILGKSWVNLTKAADMTTGTSTRYCTGVDGEGFIEGFTSGNPHNHYGGGLTPDIHDNSGILRYVSVRHAGAVLPVVAGTASDGSNELNGISLGAVGDGTTIDHIEVIGAADDNIEYFGGTVNIKNVVTMFGADDMFDFDLGYSGKVQFYTGIAMAPNDTTTNNTNIQTQDNGIEADADDDGAHPVGTYTAVSGEVLSKRSHPIFYNCTFVHNGRRMGHADNTGPAGIQGKELTELECYNSIFVNFRSGLHLATKRSVAGSAANQGGDAYDNWTSTPTVYTSADGNTAGAYGKQQSLIVKNNTFIGCQYPLTVGAMTSGKWSAIVTNGVGAGKLTAGSANDIAQFASDGNVAVASQAGFTYNWATASSSQDPAVNTNVITSKYDFCPTPQIPSTITAPTDGFFTAVSYRGAFDKDSPNWLSTWAYSALLQTTAGLQNNPTDINQDGKTDVNDFNILLGKYNQVNQ